VVGDDLDRGDLGGADSLLEEPACGVWVAPRGDEHVDDLAELAMARAGHLPPLASDLHRRSPRPTSGANPMSAERAASACSAGTAAASGSC
jgi:hypothetical protein